MRGKRLGRLAREKRSGERRETHEVRFKDGVRHVKHEYVL